MRTRAPRRSRQQIATRVHPAWCSATAEHDGDCAWIAGYVPALEGDVLVTVRQAEGSDVVITSQRRPRPSP